MRKEVLLAISIGFVLGLIITFGIWTANKSLKQLPNLAAAHPTPTVSPTQPGENTPAPTPVPAFPLSVTSPIDEALVSTSSVNITGTTVPKAVISLIYDDGSQIVVADSAGAFTAKITLEGGYNNIDVTAFNAEGKTATQNLIITYTTSKI